MGDWFDLWRQVVQSLEALPPDEDQISCLGDSLRSHTVTPLQCLHRIWSQSLSPVQLQKRSLIIPASVFGCPGNDM